MKTQPPPGLRTLRLAIALAATALCPAGAAGTERPDIAWLMERIERTVPSLLERSGVPGAAVSLVHEGRLVYSAGFGWSDPSAGVAVRPSTLFNVGSISKTVTAWGVMAAVERGALELETPVVDVLPGLPLLRQPGASTMTVGQLLAHTGGLTAPSVPEYLPWERRQSVRDWLSSPSGNVRLAAPPGGEWSYSGAGYSLLQLSLESNSAESFADYMARVVLRPLGMSESGFRHPPPGSEVARPHAEGEPIPYRRYSGLAAAGLYASSEDLARFLSAHSTGGSGTAGRGVVSAAAVARMRQADPLSWSPHGTGYGLGYAIWPLATGEPSGGHRGQNHGWSAVLWLSPDATDGIAVLTNDSSGESVYRSLLCDWAEWLRGERSFGRYCSLEEGPRAGDGGAAPAPLAAKLGELVRARVPPGGPGLAALVTRGDEVLLRRAFGSADLAHGVPLSPETPFYVASLAKPVTAALILRLVAGGRLALDDRVGELLTEFPAGGRGVTVRHLLLHTGGVPDFWQFVEWGRGLPADNEAVFALVGTASAPRASPGASFEYGNTGYLGLASLAERVTGRSFRALLVEMWPGTPASSDLFVLDRGGADLPQRALGYVLRRGERHLSDYRRLELPGKPTTHPGLATVGAGGLVATVDGLHRWARALLAGELLPPELTELSLAPGPVASGLQGLGGSPRATLGGFLTAELGSRRWVWQDGALFGHRGLMLLEPSHGTVVLLLANTDEIDLRPLAREIVDLLG